MMRRCVWVAVSQEKKFPLFSNVIYAGIVMKPSRPSFEAHVTVSFPSSGLSLEISPINGLSFRPNLIVIFSSSTLKFNLTYLLT